MQFLVREEKNLTHIYPKINFMNLTEQQEQENAEDNAEN